MKKKKKTHTAPHRNVRGLGSSPPCRNPRRQQITSKCVRIKDFERCDAIPRVDCG